ncbi:Peroxiredoxin-2 [Saguinus oedipus]|uniref:Peroxiredoxin-2 n=1 Tax=Saguinus oedipus TaxID=9490 RepID=A0ABQ9VZK3_SAGOE|nr:Peroxiredoxin-2 [Saguinus oedipus]
MGAGRRSGQEALNNCSVGFCPVTLGLVQEDGDNITREKFEDPKAISQDQPCETMRLFGMPHLSWSDAHIGKLAPDFKTTAVVGGVFKDVKLSGYKGKYLVLFFYPLDFTFVCPTEIIAFSNQDEDFRKLGCERLRASVDSPFTHLAWINAPPQNEGHFGPLNIPLLADLTRRLSEGYSVLKTHEGIAYRGLFIIDDKDVLHEITALWLVQAIQYMEEPVLHEVCAPGWKPGSDTMKPSVDDSKEYFSKHNSAGQRIVSLYLYLGACAVCPSVLPPGCPVLTRERPDLPLQTPQSGTLEG